MKKDTHPEYVETKITCNCGNVIKTRSTQKDIHVEVCSQCHPFFTGKQSRGQAKGRVESFNRRYSRKKTAAKSSK